MPSSPAIAAPAAKSVARSGGCCTSIGTSVAIRLKSSNCSAFSVSAATIRGRSDVGELRTVLQRALQRAVALQQFGGGLGADPRGARQAVGGVAAQRDEVGHLLGVDAVALTHLPRPDFLRLAVLAQLEDRRVLVHRLEEVTVAREQQRASPGLGLPAREGEHHVVRLQLLASATVQPRLASSFGVSFHCHASSAGIGSRWAW